MEKAAARTIQDRALLILSAREAEVFVAVILKPPEARVFLTRSGCSLEETNWKIASDRRHFTPWSRWALGTSATFF